MCACVGVCMCACVGVCMCACVGVCMCGCVHVWVCACVGVYRVLQYSWEYLYGIVAAKRDLVHVLKSLHHLCPLQLLSYALEISLSIMELQWLLITCTF